MEIELQVERPYSQIAGCLQSGRNLPHLAHRIPRLRKTTTIKRRVVRDTGVSRHHGGPIVESPEMPSNITALWYRGT